MDVDGYDEDDHHQGCKLLLTAGVIAVTPTDSSNGYIAKIPITTISRDVAMTMYGRFDFERADERAAVGYLLGLIVENDPARTGLMLSALVHYLGANDAGPGFYSLAAQLGLLPRGASTRAKEEFWVRQVNALHDHYSHA
ncbi:MAG: hypothetical protein M3Y48_05220 [Actinomycetota bacterium]|nr:hypothetical protein [Actinomycetota bacterium]